MWHLRRARALRDSAEGERASLAYSAWSSRHARRAHAARRCLETVDLPGDTVAAVLRAVGDEEARVLHDAAHVEARATAELVHRAAGELVRDARATDGCVYYPEIDQEVWLSHDEIRASVLHEAIDRGMELSRPLRSRVLSHRDYSNPDRRRSVYPGCIDRSDDEWRSDFAHCARLAMDKYWPELLDTADEDEADDDDEDEADEEADDYEL
jgi:hypothetical protein